MRDSLPHARGLCQASSHANRSWPPTNADGLDRAVAAARAASMAACARAASRHGARLLALSPFAIEPLAGHAHRSSAQAGAGGGHRGLDQSQCRARGSMACNALKARRGQTWLAVGNGTRRALQRAGIAARAPKRMDSEGLLAMPELQTVRDPPSAWSPHPVAAGCWCRACPSRRERSCVPTSMRGNPIPFTPRSLAALDAALAAPRHVLLALSSLEALERLLDACPAKATRRLRTSPWSQPASALSMPPALQASSASPWPPAPARRRCCRRRPARSFSIMG